MSSSLWSEKRGCFFTIKSVLSAVCLLVGILVILVGSASAQERMTDTLRVENVSLFAGDTATLNIYLANAEPLGAYSLRLVYDTAVIEMVTLSDSDSTLLATQVRGDFNIFGFGRREPGIVTGIAAFPADILEGLPPGSGVTVQFLFYVKESAQSGAVGLVDFVDDPLEPGTHNRFSGLSGTGDDFFRPVTILGIITVGEQTSLSLFCPVDTEVDCGDETDPLYTGEAISNFPDAVINYTDSVVFGTCTEEFTLYRTWSAEDFSGQEASCVQRIEVIDRQSPTITCPPVLKIEYGKSIDPATTGIAEAEDKCDVFPDIDYADLETPGVDPIHRRIDRTWRATDDCGNIAECIQVIFELAEGVPDTITIPEDNPDARLFPNWPNPFYPGQGREDSIQYYLPRPGIAEVAIYDILGRRVKTLTTRETIAAGINKVAWDGCDAQGDYVAAGVYLYRLEFDGKTIIKKMAVMR